MRRIRYSAARSLDGRVAGPKEADWITREESGHSDSSLVLCPFQ